MTYSLRDNVVVEPDRRLVCLVLPAAAAHAREVLTQSLHLNSRDLSGHA